MGIDPKFLVSDLTKVLDKCFMSALARWSDENETLTRDLAVALLIMGGEISVTKIFSQDDRGIRSRLEDEGGFSLVHMTMSGRSKKIYNVNHILFPRKMTLELGDWMNEIYCRDPSNRTITRGQESQAYRCFISNLRMGLPNLKIIDCYHDSGLMPVIVRGDIHTGHPEVDQDSALLSVFTYKIFSPWD